MRRVRWSVDLSPERARARAEQPMKTLSAILTLILCAAPVFAQSPNNSTIVVLVTDQSGAVVTDAKVSVANNQTGAVRDVAVRQRRQCDNHRTAAYRHLHGPCRSRGSATSGVATSLFAPAKRRRLKVRLPSERRRPRSPSTARPRASAPMRRSASVSTAQTIDETPILGRKVTTLPLFNSAFRQGKGTGDLFVNATYFITGSGSRRTTTFMLDGASNDEGWGRQTMLTTVPIGAVQEVAVLTNAFSAEFGWTAGPALNIVTKSGTNSMHGEGLYLARPGGLQAKTFSTDGFCPPSVPTCTTPTTLVAINPADRAGRAEPVLGIGRRRRSSRTRRSSSPPPTTRGRTARRSSRPRCRAFVLPADGSLSTSGTTGRSSSTGGVDHKLTPAQTLMVRGNYDHFYDTNPNDAVVGTSAPTVARRYTRGSRTAQVNHTTVLSSNLLNEARFAYLDGEPVTLWEAQDPSTTYTRAGSVPFTIGESRAADIFGHQVQFADTLSWSRGSHNLRFGGSVIHHTTGGSGSEPGQATLGTFTFLSTTTAPFDQLTLADVQQYSQPVSYGITSYELKQWMSVAFVQDSFRVSDQLTARRSACATTVRR